jgi:hypothetical protein
MRVSSSRGRWSCDSDHAFSQSVNDLLPLLVRDPGATLRFPKELVTTPHDDGGRSSQRYLFAYILDN